MLSQLEQELFLDCVVIGIATASCFAIVSTLMAVGKSSFRRNMLSNESIEAARSSIVRRKCISWAKRNGKLAK
jgi:hypothetical protein